MPRLTQSRSRPQNSHLRAVWGLITRQVRSATIQAELDSVLYALSFEAYERLKSENRPLHQALLSYVVTVMAERLGFASKVIGVLRR